MLTNNVKMCLSYQEKSTFSVLCFVLIWSLFHCFFYCFVFLDERYKKKHVEQRKRFYTSKIYNQNKFSVLSVKLEAEKEISLKLHIRKNRARLIFIKIYLQVVFLMRAKNTYKRVLFNFGSSEILRQLPPVRSKWKKKILRNRINGNGNIPHY